MQFMRRIINGASAADVKNPAVSASITRTVPLAPLTLPFTLLLLLQHAKDADALRLENLRRMLLLLLHVRKQ